MSDHENGSETAVIATQECEEGLETAYDYAAVLAEHFKRSALQPAGAKCQESHAKNGLIRLESVVWIEGCKASDKIVGNVLCCLTLQFEGVPRSVIRSGKNAIDAAFSAVRSIVSSWHLFADSLSLCVNGYVPLQTGLTAEICLSFSVSSGTKSVTTHASDQNLNFAGVAAIIEAVNQLGNQK